jgi:hypothetical protein
VRGGGGRLLPTSSDLVSRAYPSVGDERDARGSCVRLLLWWLLLLLLLLARLFPRDDGRPLRPPLPRLGSA